MNKTITIKGQAKLSFKPDQIILSFNFTTIEMDYESALQNNEAKVNNLIDKLLPIGFNRDDFKSTTFKITTHYESYTDENNNYQSRFAGYKANHALKLTFDLDMSRLSKAIVAISQSTTDPNLSIQFTIKDTHAVNQALLEEASANAHTIAQTLTNANGVELGQLIKIDYNWVDIQFLARTEMNVSVNHFSMARDMPEIVPDEIEVSDSVSFIWELV